MTRSNLRSGSISVSLGKPIPAETQNEKRATPKNLNKSDSKIRPDRRFGTIKLLLDLLIICYFKWQNRYFFDQWVENVMIQIIFSRGNLLHFELKSCYIQVGVDYYFIAF